MKEKHGARDPPKEITSIILPRPMLGSRYKRLFNRKTIFN